MRRILAAAAPARYAGGDMATRLYLVRHGATALSAENRFAGAVGVDLSEEGCRQAGRAAAPPTGGLCAVYGGPLGRAVQGAELLAEPMKLELQQRDGLREISHGRWEGLTRAEVETRFPGEYEAWEADPFPFAPEGGESGVAVLARALPVVREIVVRHDGQRVLVVSHKATLRLLLPSLLGFDPPGYADPPDQAPASPNAVDFKAPVRARLMLFNDTSHYANQPREAHPNQSKWWD